MTGNIGTENVHATSVPGDAGKRRGGRVRTDETSWPVQTAIIDDNGGIVLNGTVVIDLPEDASWRIDWPNSGRGISLSGSDERQVRTVSGSRREGNDPPYTCP